MPVFVRRVALLCVVLLLSGGGWAQTSFSSVVVFGDSLSDTGNIANLVENANPLKVRFPADNQLLGLNYTDGRFTDGTDTQPAAKAYLGVWIEQLAASFPAKPPVKNSLDGGTNYAYGDATTGAGTTTESQTFGGTTLSISLHNMGQQVSDYMADVASKAAPAPAPGTLFVLWGGANDLYQAAAAKADLGAATQTAITNELTLVNALAGAGATNFMIPNLPLLGGVPSHATDPNATALNAAAAGFAQGLAQGIAALKTDLAARGITVTIYQPDIFGPFGQSATSPMSVGLGNITAKAQGVSGSPDPYLIWDGLHPTTTGHHLVAAAAANLLTPLVSSTTAASFPAAVLAGQSFAVTANVAGSVAGKVPSGLVTFYVDSAYVGSATLDGTGVATATFTPAATAGSYAFAAVYAGDTTYSVSTSAAQPFAAVSAPVATTTVLSAGGASVNSGAPVTLTATVTPAVSTYGTPTGTVTFLNGSATLGTGTLANGVATFTTTSLPTGSLALTATYPAAGVFGASTSAVLTETVVAPGFTPAASPSSLTLGSGSSGNTTLSFTGVGGFTGPVTLSCGQLPTHFSCAFSTTTLSSSSSSNQSVLTIATNVATADLLRPERPGTRRSPETFAAGLLLPGSVGLLLLGFYRRRLPGARLWLSVAIVCGIGMSLGLTGCGSSSKNNAAAGSYSVPVVFTPAAGAAQTVNIAVTVQ